MKKLVAVVPQGGLLGGGGSGQCKVEYCDTPDTERREQTGNTKQTYTLNETSLLTKRLPIHLPQDGVERCGTLRTGAESPRHASGALHSCAPTPRSRDNSGSHTASRPAPRAGRGVSGNQGSLPRHRSTGAGMGTIACSSIKAFWLMCGRNLPVLPHLGQNALSLRYNLLSTTPPKTE